MNSISSPYEKVSHKLKLAMSTAVAALMLVPAAYAQDDTTDETSDDEIVVTGIRAALKNARDLKRDADVAIDSITASDVSTLPDLSVAEALARVPGVVVQRFELGGSAGDFPSPEGGGNLIRGLTLVKTEFNGRDAFSANGGRALDFGTIPPELIGAVDVYKQTSADRVEGGIGGGINLRTLEPFDRPDGFAVVTVDGTYTDLRDEISPDISFVAGERWNGSHGEFGLLGSVSHSELQSELHGFQIGQLAAIPIEGETIAIPGGFQLRTNEVNRERQSYYAAGQWQNNDGDFKATLKFARIENEVDSDERTTEWFTDGEQWFLTNVVGDVSTSAFNSSGIPECNGSNDPDAANASCENTNAVSGLYSGGVISNEIRDWTGAAGAPFTNLGIHQRDKSATQDLSLNVQWRPAENWFVNADVHRTTADFDQERLWGGTRFFSNFELNADLDNPSVNFVPDTFNTGGLGEFVGDPNRGANDPIRRFQDGSVFGQWTGAGANLDADLANPDNTFLLFAADEFQENEGNLTAARLDVEYEFDNDGWFDGVQVGARLAERNQINRRAGLNWGAVAPPWEGANGIPASYLPIAQAQAGFETVDLSDFQRGGVVQGDSQVLFVDRALLQDYDAFVASLAGDPLIDQRRVGINPDGTVQDGARSLCNFGRDSYGPWVPLRLNGQVNYDCGSIGDLTENTTNFYARLNFGNEFENGMSIEGNIGLRYSDTNIDSRGGINYAEINTANVNPITMTNDELTFAPESVAFLAQSDILQEIEISDEHFLPSLNVKLNLNEDMLLRFGASRDITRPNIGDLNANQVNTISFTREFGAVDPANPTGPRPLEDLFPNQINVFGGNPNLKAIESLNLDASFEWYFGDDNAFSLAAFRKEIENNIIFAQERRGQVTLDGREVPISFNGLLNQDEATLNGFEVAYTQFFDELPGLLSNTGIQANYTYVDAEAEAPPAVVDADGDGAPDDFTRIFRYGVTDFLGLSKHSANVIGIYQDERMEWRLAYNWRSEHLSSYRDFVSGNPIFQKDRGYLDGSFKFDVSDSLQFRAQVANILDTKAQADQQIDADGQRFGRTSFVGDRRVKVGLRYQFD